MEKGINYIELYPELFSEIKGFSDRIQAKVLFFKPFAPNAQEDWDQNWSSEFIFGSDSYAADIFNGTFEMSEDDIKARDEIYLIMNYLQAYHDSELLRTIYQSRL